MEGWWPSSPSECWQCRNHVSRTSTVLLFQCTIRTLVYFRIQLRVLNRASALVMHWYVATVRFVLSEYYHTHKRNRVQTLWGKICQVLARSLRASSNNIHGEGVSAAHEARHIPHTHIGSRDCKGCPVTSAAWGGGEFVVVVTLGIYNTPPWRKPNSR